MSMAQPGRAGRAMEIVTGGTRELALQTGGPATGRLSQVAQHGG